MANVLVIVACTTPTFVALMLVQPDRALLGYLVTAGVAVALWWRRSHPLTVLLIVVALGALNPLSAASPAVAVPESFFGVFTLASLTRVPVALGGYVLSEAVIFAVGGASVFMGFREVYPAVLLQPAGLIALALGIAVRASRLRREAVISLIAEREKRAAQLERARITAEMHDVVAHSVTVMVALAGGARAGWEKHPERARAALEQLGAVGEHALIEMQRILHVFRDGEDSVGAPLERSGHDVPSLDELAQVFRASGLSVTLTGADAVPALSPTLRTTVYRIVQEALTNSLRHAREVTKAEIAIRETPGKLTITVTDNGRGTTPVPSVGAGVGLLAMRERVTAFGGTLEAGPIAAKSGAPGAGWQVRATLVTHAGATT